MISAHSAKETTAQDESGSEKKEKGGGSKPKQPRAREKVKNDIETQSGELFCHPSLLGVWCVCAGPKGPVVARSMPEFAHIFKY
jgi:hypothetical protein